MKKALIFVLMLSLPILSFAQLKEQAKLPSMSQVIANPSSNLIFGFINPDNIDMHHQFSMSYMTMGRNNLMLNAYTNTINYRISNPLMLRLNLGVMNSPYGSFSNPALNNTQFFGGAELLYRPTENSMIKVGMNIGPGFYYPRYNNYWYER